MDVDDLDDATLVAGAPRSGKTRFALDMLVAAMKRHGDAYAVMTVSGRQVADRLGDTVIRELSAISQARPVTTLPAVAFRIMTAVRSHAGQPLPQLLNGAEQDVVIRRVLSKQAPPAHYCAPTSWSPTGRAWWWTTPPTPSPTSCATCLPA